MVLLSVFFYGIENLLFGVLMVYIHMSLEIYILKRPSIEVDTENGKISSYEAGRKLLELKLNECDIQLTDSKIKIQCGSSKLCITHSQFPTIAIQKFGKALLQIQSEDTVDNLRAYGFGTPYDSPPWNERSYLERFLLIVFAVLLLLCAVLIYLAWFRNTSF